MLQYKHHTYAHNGYMIILYWKIPPPKKTLVTTTVKPRTKTTILYWDKYPSCDLADEQKSLLIFSVTLLKMVNLEIVQTVLLMAFFFPNVTIVLANMTFSISEEPSFTTTKWATPFLNTIIFCLHIISSLLFIYHTSFIFSLQHLSIVLYSYHTVLTIFS